MEFNLNIVNPEAEKLAKALGINDERAEELWDKYQNLTNFRHVSRMIKEALKEVKTLEEAVLVVFAMGMQKGYEAAEED